VNNQIWERKYPPLSLWGGKRMLVYPDVRKRLKIFVVQIGAPSYSEGLAFLLDFHEKMKEEENYERRNVKKDI